VEHRYLYRQLQFVCVIQSNPKVFAMSSMQRMEEEDDEDMAAKAYASIAAQLQQFTSPKLGSLPPRSSSAYDDSIMMDDEDEDMDAVEWMKRDLQQDYRYKSPVTPKRTPILERADTPVMSNSSSKLHQTPDEQSSPAIQEPVQTPGNAFQAIPRPKVHSPRAVSAPAVLATKAHHPNQSPFVYRRYHDTLWNYLKAKRSLSRSLDLERQGQALEAMTLDDAGPTTSSLASREQRAELDYLSQLQQLCWSTPSPETFLEGDCWMLLVTLRQLGLSALVWDNDGVSTAQNKRAQTGFLQQLASLIEETPSQILQRLASNQAPLVLQRRYSILQWIQTCLDQVRVPPKTTSALARNTATVSHPDDSETPSLVPEATQQQLLQASLSYILAGRLDDAKALVRSNGQPWRAAAWSGGQAIGYEKTPNPETKTMDVRPTGNPDRFLWKRQVWKNGRRLSAASSSSSTATVEAAISALLANDVPTCLANPHLRTWSQALGATFMGLWGRSEDEVLHLHNTQRRNHTKNLPFPGTQNAILESEQLMATSQLAGMTELQALQLLSCSPFGEIHDQGSYERAMAAFCVGKSAILDFLHNETEQVVAQTQDQQTASDAALAQLRFLTHLALFLDSLQVSTTPVVLSGLTEQKNQVVFRYVQYLESRPELWHLVTLYVSLLPDERLLEWYPSMLVKVLEDTERQSMLESMQSLFPHLQVHVLKQTVRLCLGSRTASDDIKCLSIQWLLYDEHHAGEALICSNILLRELFLENDDDKIEAAIGFVDDYLPEDLVDRAEHSLHHESSSDATKVTNARTEHLAFLSYLEAYRTFGKWKDILADTPTNIADSLAKQIDLNNLNHSEHEIAIKRRVRDWASQKKKHFETLLQAAEHARKVLYSVLTHPGGWLALEEEDIDSMVVDDEGQKRRKDMQTIRSRYLVLAVNLYHQVCEETASWMSRSLDDAMHIMTRDEALKSLQDKSYQPDVWYQNAMDLAIVIADDRYGIHKALGPNALKDILAKLAETAVSKLMSSAS
jgi:hypothetical protein